MSRKRASHRLSRKTVVLYGEPVIRNGKRVTREVLRNGQQKEEWSFEREQSRSLFNAISTQHFSGENNFPDDHDDDGIPTVQDITSGMYDLPPGQEGMLNSHAGGEYHYHNLLASLLENPRSGDSRTRRDRIEKQIESWKAQLPDLVSAYLAFMNRGAPQKSVNSEEWSLYTMDLNEAAERIFFHPDGSPSINASLLRHGYIGATPDRPTIAFSLHLFHVFRQFNRVCPKFSIDALSKALQHIHLLPRHEHLEDQLRGAYDAYLAVLREIRCRTQQALGRDNPDGFTNHLCAPCLYWLDDDPLLRPAMLAAMDGNNSMKLVDSTIRAGKERLDSRQLLHTRWLETHQVDQFADEVKRAPTRSQVNVNNADDDGDGIAWLNINETEELTSCIDTCVDRWKAAGPDAKKRMFAMFSISGIFLSVCRHGHVLVICDMIRSGELMKYPLSIVDTLIDLYGADIGLGYDIMCAFYKTMMRSPKLKNKVLKSGLVGVVPSFHGHAHNRKCQVSWHPQYMEGVGLEDFEECERTFSLSNRLASTTRLATRFHRRQAIQEFLDFHDHDKHNYRQALERLAKDVPLFEEACKKLNITADDCEAFLVQEREHFNKVFEEPPEAMQSRDYAELLQKLWKSKLESDAAHKKWRTLGTSAARGLSDKEIKAIKARNWTTRNRHDNVLEQVLMFEDDHGIHARWTPLSKEYLDALKGLVERQYRQALEQLERLVVQRLFELTKLNGSEVGYKQRDKIEKALRSRAEAIRKALDRYNTLAQRLEPPRPTLTWNSIIEMVTLADFDLLKDTHLDIARLAWTKPENREVMQLHFGIRRAREEIERLNVELRRLITYMIDDHADYWHLLSDTGTTSLERSNFEAHLRRELQYHTAIHARMAERILQISQLNGFTGSLLPGQQVDRPRNKTAIASLPKWVGESLGIKRVVNWESDSGVTYERDLSLIRLHPEDIDAYNGDDPRPDIMVSFMEGLSLGDSQSEFNYDSDD